MTDNDDKPSVFGWIFFSLVIGVLAILTVLVVEWLKMGPQS